MINNKEAPASEARAIIGTNKGLYNQAIDNDYFENLQFTRLNDLRACSLISGLSSDEADEMRQLKQLKEAIEQRKISETLSIRIIDLRKCYTAIVFLLLKDGVGCISIGDIIAIKAKAKQGKTFTIICFIAALLNGNYIGFKATKKALAILYIDTEQNPINTAKLAQKVHLLCGFPIDQNNPQFVAMNLRGDNPDKRCEIVEEAVKSIRPDVLFLDGVKDLIYTDINSQEQSGKVTQLLMNLTKNYPMAIFTVIHENKKDQNMRGAIGTELLNKCSECWQVKKDGNIFEVEQTESRNQPVDGFSFRVDENGQPVPIDYIPKLSTTEKTTRKKVETLCMCLKPHETKTYSELKTMYMEIGACKEKTAELHISDATKRNWLERDSQSGKYKLHYTHLPYNS